MATPAAKRINNLCKIIMKTYRIKVTKDEKEMIESALHQLIDLTKDAIHDNEFDGDAETVKELKQEMKLMRESLRAMKSAKN